MLLVMRVNFKCVKAAASLCGPCGDLSLRDRVPVNTLQIPLSSMSVRRDPLKQRCPLDVAAAARGGAPTSPRPSPGKQETQGLESPRLLVPEFPRLHCWAANREVCYTVFRTKTFHSPPGGRGLEWQEFLLL